MGLVPSKEEFLYTHSCLREMAHFSSDGEKGETTNISTFFLMSSLPSPLWSNGYRGEGREDLLDCGDASALKFLDKYEREREKLSHITSPQEEANKFQDSRTLVTELNICLHLHTKQQPWLMFIQGQCGKTADDFLSEHERRKQTQIVFWLDVLFGGWERGVTNHARKK